MSDDELEKLAAAMKDISPSKASRKSGMEVAMAAFDMEFAADTTTEKVNVSEENLATTQGFEGAARPIGQSIGGGSVQAFGRYAMTTLNKIFNMTPKTAMMGGSCMAAFIAAFVVYQSVPGDQFIIPDAPSKSAVTAEVMPDVAAPRVTESDEIVVTAKKADPNRGAVGKNLSEIQSADIASVPSTEDKLAAPAAPAPQVQSGITSIDNLMNKIQTNPARPEAENSQADKTLGGNLVAAKENKIARSAANSSFAPPTLQAPQPLIRQGGDKRSRHARGQITSDTASNAGSPHDANIPMVEKQVTRRVMKTPARTQERAIPAVTKTETRRFVKTPARTMERVKPAITKEVTRRVASEDGTFETVTETVVVQEASTELVSVPPVYGTVSETVVVQEASTELVTIPATFETVTETVLVPAGEQFEDFKTNPITEVTEKPVSTFSIDVDTASYSFMRSSLNRGQLPRPSSIRLEEMINYFPYDYEAPRSADEPFKANVTVTPTPWNADTKLMHIGIKGYVPPADEKPRSNLVFLIDTSGSMNQTNKLPLLINSFKLLLNTLDEDDTVSIVTYAGRAGTVLEPTPASDKHAIKSALERLRAGGSTAGAAGLELAYQQAQENFDDEGINRVILATDGDFNVGFSSPEEMKTFIKDKRETGIFLSVLGFGRGNYNDHLMQSLAQNGNGVAAYIDTLSEANKVLANEAGSALITIAKDVKIQVEFNPDTISEYRLIGYETRALKRQDFNNDKVDAGDIGAGHSVTAIYELTPVGSPAIANDPLRYITEKLDKKGKGSEELAFVKIRHKLPKSDTSTLQTFPIGPSQERSLKRASDDMRFAAAVAAIGQKLRGDTQLSDFSFDDAIELASGARGDDENGYRAEFIQLARLAETLQK